MHVDANPPERKISRKRLVRPGILIAAVVLSMPLAYVLHRAGFVGPLGRFSGSKDRSTMQTIHAGGGRDEGIRHGPIGAFRTDGPILVDMDGLAIHGYDVVAYFTTGEPTKGLEQYELTHDGVTFRFASQEHREQFAESPDEFIPAYGGYCAVGVSANYKDGMHPDAFEIVDGRLFFNLTPDIHRHWQRRKDELIARGDRNWPELKDSRRAGPGLGPGGGD